MRDDRYIAKQLAINLNGNFHLLAKYYSEPLRRYAYKFVHDDAEDVVQEAFLLAYEALRGYSAERIEALNVEPWLYTITRHRCLRMMNQSEQKVEALPLDMSDVDIADDSVEREQKRRELLDAIDELPLPYRQVMYLRFVKDWKLADIARELGKGEGTVKTYLYRGKKLLRKKWQEALSEEGL